MIWGSCALGFNETCFGFCVFANNVRIADQRQYVLMTVRASSVHGMSSKKKFISGHHRNHPFVVGISCQSLSFHLLPFLLSSVPGYCPKDSHLSVSGPRYYLVTLFLHSAFWLSSSLLCADGPRMFNLFVARKCEIMAVMSRFTVALLTEGRSARDLPKQHPDKKNLPSKVLPYCTW